MRIAPCGFPVSKALMFLIHPDRLTEWFEYENDALGHFVNKMMCNALNLNTQNTQNQSI